MTEKTFAFFFWTSFAVGGVLGWFGVRKALKRVLGV